MRRSWGVGDLDYYSRISFLCILDYRYGFVEKDANWYRDFGVESCRHVFGSHLRPLGAQVILLNTLFLAHGVVLDIYSSDATSVVPPPSRSERLEALYNRSYAKPRLTDCLPTESILRRNGRGPFYAIYLADSNQSRDASVFVGYAQQFYATEALASA